LLSPDGRISVGSLRPRGFFDAAVWVFDPQGAIHQQPPTVEPPVCPPPAKADLADIVTLGNGKSLACFGRSELTFRAWKPSTEGLCGCGEGLWLQFEGVHMSPLQAVFGSTRDLAVAPRPSVTPQKMPDNVWLSITGHFDDPAAAGCTYVPVCRKSFAVDTWHIIDGG
jgi:hypothetical protein